MLFSSRRLLGLAILCHHSECKEHRIDRAAIVVGFVPDPLVIPDLEWIST
jgi:hypothetical protein